MGHGIQGHSRCAPGLSDAHAAGSGGRRRRAPAALLGARISGIACAPTPRVPRSILGDALINVSGLVAAESHKIAVSAQAVLTTFQDAAAKRGVLGQHILHKCQTSEVAGALADFARLRDLAILPMPEGDYLQQLDFSMVRRNDHFRIRSPDHRPAVRPQRRPSDHAQHHCRGLGQQPRRGQQLSPMPFPYSDKRRSRAW